MLETRISKRRELKKRRQGEQGNGPDQVFYKKSISIQYAGNVGKNCIDQGFNKL